MLITFLFLFLAAAIYAPRMFAQSKSYETEGLIVLEVVPNNKSIKNDELANFSDYIRIYNNSNSAVDLENYSLTDDFRSPDKWRFPSYKIGPYEDIYVFLDGADTRGLYFHTNFSLNNEGEELWFKNSDGNDIFKWRYDEIGEDVVYSLVDGNYILVDKNRFKGAEMNLLSFNQYLALQEENAVLFSRDSGFYNEEFELALYSENEKCVIRYTLDGSDPSINSAMYFTPIKITTREDDENEFISSSVAYTGTNLNARYVPKPEDTKRATVIKAAAYVGSARVGEVTTKTYFVDDKSTELYSLPVVSLVCDPDDLFSGEDGIYVIGDTYEWEALKDIFNNRTKSSRANYNQRGEDWRRPCHFEYFEQSRIVYEQDVGIQIFGGASRGENKKSFKLVTKTFSQGKMSYPFFNGLKDKYGNPIESFDELILRNGGTVTQELAFLDSVHSNIASKNLDTQASKSVVVFLNGNYYGIYQLVEVLSDKYISDHYGTEEEDIEIFKTLDYDLGVVENKYYESLVDYAKNNDLTIQSNYDYIAGIIDIENMLEYFVFQMYIANTDWPAANNKVWRILNTDYDENHEHTDGKYRYVLFDTDCGMNYVGDKRFNDLHPTMFHWVFENKYTNYDKLGIRSLDIVEKLIKNESFKQVFINKFCDRVNVDYDKQVFYDQIDIIAAQLESEINNDLTRYLHQNGSIGNWKYHIKMYREYVAKRNTNIFIEMSEYFGCQIGCLNIEKSDGGYININNNVDVAVAEDFAGKYMSGVDVVLTAVPDNGYAFAGWSDGAESAERAIVFSEEMLELNFQAIFKKVK